MVKRKLKQERKGVEEGRGREREREGERERERERENAEGSGGKKEGKGEHYAVFHAIRVDRGALGVEKVWEKSVCVLTAGGGGGGGAGRREQKNIKKELSKINDYKSELV